MKRATSAVLLSALPALALAETPTLEELHIIIQQQQEQIESLQQQSTEQQSMIDLTADAVGSQTSSSSATTIGGYAEVHYNSLNDKEETDGYSDKNEIDIHRFVLFVGHQFDERTRFFAELEVEHALAGEGKPGEVELEQAYIEHDLTGSHQAKAGVFLIPVGFLNETHEPDTFYGVERNNVEKNIIPSTWWEGGLAFNGELGEGFSYDIAVHSGLAIDVSDSKYKIRDGRQKVSEAEAQDFATTVRLKYTGVKGLELGLTLQNQSDVTQSEFDGGISADLVEFHIAYQVQGFGIRAMHASWELDEEMNDIQAGAAEQTGWYIEPSYRINEQWGVFVRSSEWDNQADDSSLDTAISQVDVGFNYWLHPNAVLKFDYQDQTIGDDAGSKEMDGFNLGVGVSF